jgi:CRISPR/Cas system CMR subunit Cmr6 (Cas7 group RAMP superfamily)
MLISLYCKYKKISCRVAIYWTSSQKVRVTYRANSNLSKRNGIICLAIQSSRETLQIFFSKLDELLKHIVESLHNSKNLRKKKIDKQKSWLKFYLKINSHGNAQVGQGNFFFKHTYFDKIRSTVGALSVSNGISSHF